jgi:hypothetical protein
MILLAWLGLIALVHVVRTAMRPEVVEPQPRCLDCEDRRFLDVRGLDLHRRAAHPDCFEDRPVTPDDVYRMDGGHHGDAT